MSDKFDKYMKTYSAKMLLEKHSLEETNTWEVRGEDPNCDFGGPHHQPLLGIFEGVLYDVIEHAVELPGFWQWGAGGDIKARRVTKVVKINPQTRAKRQEIRNRIQALESELASLKKQLDDLT